MLARWVVAVVVGLALGAGPLSAQPAAALGKPLPSPDLPVGTLAVRVIDGTPTAPHEGLAVWLSVDGAARSATTDAAGRAVFAGLPAGANVTAAISVVGSSVKSDAFVVPRDGGTRIVLSTVPLAAAGGPPLPKPRASSGQPRPMDGTPPGSLEVQLSYNDPADPKPPARIPVTLVGYRADGSVTSQTQPTDGRGSARFAALDHSGAVAYFALATLPRQGSVDRLMAAPIVLDDLQGAWVGLSADERRAITPPIDDLGASRAPKGKLHVQIEGLTEAGSQVRVVDAATGKQVASATAETNVTLDQPRAGKVLYVEAIVRGEPYRSRPFQPVADRGADVMVIAYPRVLLRFSMLAEPVGVAIVTWGQFSLQNNSWIPYAAPLAIPLPKGFAKPSFAEDDRALASFTATGFQLARPLRPGDQRVRARFELAAGGDGVVHWDLELPLGAFQSGFRITDEPGLTLTAPGLAVAPATLDGETSLAIADITIMPARAMAMTIQLPKLTARQAAVARACQPLEPDRKSELRGKRMPDVTAPQLDGTPLKLASLRGKLILVNFMATWDMLSANERPTFTPLAAALGKELAIVLVASDTDRAEVAAKIGPKPAFRVVLDPSAQPLDRVGPITTAWGVHLLPESFLVDRHGVVRLYFANARDWSTPDARACLEAVARD